MFVRSLKLDGRFELKYSTILTSWTMALVGALAIGGAIYQQLQAPLNTGQETVVSSTTRVVVILIPGFPIESFVLGGLLGLMVLIIIRRRKLGAQG